MKCLLAAQAPGRGNRTDRRGSSGDRKCNSKGPAREGRPIRNSSFALQLDVQTLVDSACGCCEAMSSS